jgi:uncharacterized protein
MPSIAIKALKEPVAEFCRRWNIVAMELFGSALRPDFHHDSDVDFLVTFAPDAHWTLLDLTRMENELAAVSSAVALI